MERGCLFFTVKKRLMSSHVRWLHLSAGGVGATGIKIPIPIMAAPTIMGILMCGIYL